MTPSEEDIKGQGSQSRADWGSPLQDPQNRAFQDQVGRASLDGDSGWAGAEPSRGSPGLAGTGVPPPGTAHASHRGQPGCSGWQPPVGRERQVRGSRAGPLGPPGPPDRSPLTAGCSGPRVCSRICRASCRRSVASLYLFWSLWGGPRMEAVGQGGAAGARLSPAGVAPSGGPVWVSPHPLSLARGPHTSRAPPSLWPPQVLPHSAGVSATHTP